MMAAQTRRRRQPNPHRHFVRRGALLLLPILSVLAASGQGPGATTPHGSVDLIAEQTSVQPTQPFWVGLRFQLEPGWHIYWTNPGDSGEPPRIKWSLPAGFGAGPLQWPVPRRIEDHSLIDYGYQNEVLLPIEIMPRGVPIAGSDVQLSARVNWLVCREICVPGHAALALTLPFRRGPPGPPSPAHSLFAKARADLPRPIHSSWKVTAILAKDRFVLNVETGTRETNATFFPFEPNQIENAAPQKASPFSRGVRIELRRSDQMLKAPPQLRGVLVFTSGRGYVIEAPVTTSK